MYTKYSAWLDLGAPACDGLCIHEKLLEFYDVSVSSEDFSPAGNDVNAKLQGTAR